MVKFKKVLFSETKVNDRFFFNDPEVFTHSYTYRRICQVGNRRNSILWLEPNKTYPEGKIAQFSPTDTTCVWLIMED